jgi:hypothetical protein
VKHVFFGYWVALVVLLFAGGAGAWLGSWNNQLQGKMRQASNLVRNFSLSPLRQYSSSAASPSSCLHSPSQHGTAART